MLISNESTDWCDEYVPLSSCYSGSSGSVNGGSSKLTFTGTLVMDYTKNSQRNINTLTGCSREAPSGVYKEDIKPTQTIGDI